MYAEGKKIRVSGCVHQLLESGGVQSCICFDKYSTVDQFYNVRRRHKHMFIFRCSNRVHAEDGVNHDSCPRNVYLNGRVHRTAEYVVD